MAPENEVELRWIAVARTSDLAPGTARVVRAGGHELALVCTAEGVFALDNACPHAGGPLGEGRVEGSTLTCPLHGWQFDCARGVCLTEKRPRQPTYAVRIEGDQVLVEVPAPRVTESKTDDPATKQSPVEVWKQAKHGIDVWPDVLRHAREKTPMSKIDDADLERMKWYGYFQRKNNDADHYMCRIRIPGCTLTADQARAVASVAYESGYSIIDVTTRGNVQIQGLGIAVLPRVRAALERVGLTSRQSGHDNVRNVTCHPWSGIDPDELVDTRALARHIQDMVVGDREFADLPRKVNVALCGRSDPAAHAWTQDVSYVACVGPDSSVGFQLLLGGNQGQAPKLACPVPVFLRPGQILEVTAALLRTFRELGWRHNRHQVRLRSLIDRIGLDGVVLDVERRLGYELPRFPRPIATPARHETFVGWFKQKQDDLWALGVCVPVGRLTAEELDGLSVVARQHGDGTLRTTYDQNLVIPGIATAARDEAAYAVARFGLTAEPDLATRNTVACTGKQFCNIAVTETKGYAFRLIEELRRRRVQLHGIELRMSGCPSACAMNHTADIGLKGVKIRRGLRVLDAFDVSVGGGLGARVELAMLYQKGVPFGELPEVVETLVREFSLHRARGETFSQYWRRRLARRTPEVVAGQELPRWGCTRCAHVHVAADPPPFCPICAAIRSKFQPLPEDGLPAAAAAPTPIATKTPAGKRVLIVGGGIAGHTVAQAVRGHDPDARLTLLTDDTHSFYNRLNLTRLLAQEIPRETLFDYGPAWYQEHGVEVLTGARVIGLDPLAKLALLSEGRELAYDACVLAPGASALPAPFYRDDLDGVHLLRTLADVDAIAGRLRPDSRVAVIGGGVLGLEAAAGIQSRGASVRVFESLPHLMPRQLDRYAAGLVQDALRARGIECLVGIEVERLLGGSSVEGVALRDGRSFDADLVIVSTGIKPNTDWIARSGIRCGRGVLVDDQMHTSAADVYAAGDVAEWRGRVVGLWTNAIEQARVAAANACGRHALFQGSVPVTILKCLGLPVTSIGEIQEDGNAISSRVAVGAGVYRRLVLRDGIPVGALMVGTSSGTGELQRLVEGGVALDALRRSVLPDAEVVA